VQNAAALRRLFFSSNLPDAELERLRQRFVEHSPTARLVDVRALQVRIIIGII